MQMNATALDTYDNFFSDHSLQTPFKLLHNTLVLIFELFALHPFVTGL